ncbi:MAG TPA: ABC transporter substrate-binding protein [Clostridiaceae bacterium]|nr:ABC transporter substrate-binding protein [Clostridiaceae bacterium]
MSRKVIKGMLWLFILLIAIALIGCAPSKAKGKIKIGVIGPQTGASAETGQAVSKGAEIAANMINEKGGINGREIELIIADGKNDPAESLNAANKLMLQDEVVAIVGCCGSSATLAVMPAVESNKVPLVVETASAAKITEAGNPFVFRIAATTRQEAQAVEEILPEIGFNKVALLGVNTDWGRGAEEEFTEVVERQGGEIVCSEYFEGNAIDFYSQLTTIKNSGADSIILTADSSLIILILRQMKDLGVDLPVLTSGGSDFTDGIIELVGADIAEGLRSIAFFNPAIPEAAASQELHKYFVDKWQEKDLLWRKMPEGTKGFDAVCVLAEAMKGISGDINGESLQKALQGVEYAGITGHLKFDEKGQAVRSSFLVRVKDGKTVLD